MAFDQEVREYLEEVDRQPRSAEPPPRSRHIDASALREHFLERLREIEQESEPSYLEALYREWSPKLTQLADHLEALPQPDMPVDEKQALAFGRQVLDLALKRGDAARSAVERLELSRILDGFIRASRIEPYVLENRLARRDLALRTEVTGLGRAFLRLRGPDAVRWLLTIEVTQSRGSRDPWRASRELLERLLSTEGLVDQDEWGIRLLPFPFEIATLERLVRLDVAVAYAAEGGVSGCRVDEAMRDVVQRVLDGGPWHAAVAALLEDERADVLPALGPRAADAAVEQTRMFAHEVRNALIPVRHDVDALLKAGDAASRARLESARRGVVRVLAFVDEMVATSELLGEPLTSFDVGDVIRDALGWLDGGQRVELALSAGAAKLRGRRSRLQRAVSNVILNALQATSAGQRVRVQVRRSAGTVEIAVDDGGPGVPKESRSIVFHDGYTTRGGVGGSGFGLAYVRAVVEDLHGKVWCEASELGGARFVMALPEGEAGK